MKLLLIEDNESIILGLEYLLQEEGFRFDTARTAAEAERAVIRERYDLALLDISLPDGDGFRLWSKISREQELPVIFLTAREEEQAVVRAFDLGADDYIIKPFRNRELISRNKNVLRRRGHVSKVLYCGSVKMDTETTKVYVDGQELPVPLTRLEYKILNIMMNHPSKLFTREEILSLIWDASGSFVNDNTLSVTIKRIREKIGDKEGRFLKTVRGMGYRLES